MEGRARTRRAAARVGANVSQSSSYHATVSSIMLPEAASMSPSPSTSIAKTDMAPSASAEMVCFVKAVEVPSFWYQLMALSPSSAESASTDPSPSTSMAKVEDAPFAESSMMDW